MAYLNSRLNKPIIRDLEPCSLSSPSCAFFYVDSPAKIAGTSMSAKKRKPLPAASINARRPPLSRPTGLSTGTRMARQLFVYASAS
ncbi:MAG: hypothetical protein BJ554DRAFT_7473 [Olpidium bornovanus]|uniref:Uncharacterized protein n=1 Tax=Olpidium bornovanus TaxID=278681 RepID=A0A8H8A2E1_9FUNG|nr:MAG: hypothetical protein BJ554DRAFT_7473 [Olpidium bornovanus]